MLSDFKVAEEALKELKKPQGEFIENEELKKLIPERIIAVGDEINLKLVELGIKPALAVFDYQIKRAEISKEEQEKLEQKTAETIIFNRYYLFKMVINSV